MYENFIRIFYCGSDMNDIVQSLILLQLYVQYVYSDSTVRQASHRNETTNISNAVHAADRQARLT